jgi:hypothetical protein
MSVTEVIHTFTEPEPTEENRYGLYGRDGDNIYRIAETSKEGIGTALVQLAEDRRENGESAVEIIGVLDRIERRWITGLWPRRASAD